MEVAMAKHPEFHDDSEHAVPYDAEGSNKASKYHYVGMNVGHLRFLRRVLLS